VLVTYYVLTSSVLFYIYELEVHLSGMQVDFFDSVPGYLDSINVTLLVSKYDSAFLPPLTEVSAAIYLLNAIPSGRTDEPDKTCSDVLDNTCIQVGVDVNLGCFILAAMFGTPGQGDHKKDTCADFTSHL
jgi:hypothetical protein